MAIATSGGAGSSYAYREAITVAPAIESGVTTISYSVTITYELK